MQKQFIPRRKDRRSAPLSFAQQRLWFLDQLESESSAYNRSNALRLDGILNLGALSMALDAIVERHEVIRTTYVVEESGDPIQRIGQPQAVELAIIDLTECPQSERDEQAQRMIADLTERPFELSRDLMLRAKLLRLALDQHVLVVVIHHVASDGWSSGILWRELAAYYTAFSQGKSVSLPELPIQYADYAAWQREWLSGEDLASQLDYWKKQLQDLPTLQLPTDRPRPAVQSYRGAQQAFKLSKELTQGLKKLSRDEGVTLFMTLLAAFQTLLSRYSGQEDFCIGSPIANRKYVEVEGLIGFFVNTLVLRSDLSGKPTFRELLSKVKRTALQSYAHQDLPFEKLVEELQPERNLGVSPLFQVMFALQNYPRNDFALSGLAVSPIELHHNTAKFDLSLTLTETTDGFEGQLEYSTDLFDPTTVARMIFHFQTLLEGVVSNPDQRISELPILTEPERRQLLVQWNDTKRDYPSDTCIHRLFEEQVARTPDAVAVVFEDQQLTYRELNNRANQLAHYLQKLGVGPEMLVGICLERSLDMVVSVLGVLKAGAAYVPLDLSYPTERLAFILNDTKASVLLTRERWQMENRARTDKKSGEIIRGDSAVKVVCFDNDWIYFEKESRENIEAVATADDLAYVIYTSGSTGQPKGVMVNHRALVAHTLSAVEHYELGNGDKVLQFASLSFDVAGEEIFPAWLSGASVVLLPERVPTIADFVHYLIKDGITVANLPSAYWHQWVDELDRLEIKFPPSLRLLIVGNEKVSLDHFKRWQQAFDSNVRWLNAYGPTEATITATLYEAPRGDENYRNLRSVPIGRPMTNRQIYILDRYLQPVPIGVTGEIHIGGAALAVGYLNDSELTAKKFNRNPFTGELDARVYSTGDRARYLPNGNIELMGRMDDQVKIHGYRIEIGEIEAVLNLDPVVQECAVVAWDGNIPESSVLSATDQWLVAYVVVKPRSESTSAEMRNALKLKLPEYMVPYRFVFLDSLPRTLAGKLDRKALPSPDPGRPDLTAIYVAPRTSLERTLAGIWAEVLKLERVGIYDNFFDLGGHSLLATQIIPRVNDALRVNVHLRSLFESPTVVEFAKQIQATSRKLTDPTLLSIEPFPAGDECPLSFSQQRFWFLSQMEPTQCAYNESSVFRLDGALHVEALQRAFGEIVRRHETLRTTFAVRDGVPVQIIGEPRPVPLRIIDLADRRRADFDAEIRRLFKKEFHTPFDLRSDPMLRVTLLRFSDTEHVLFVIIHHIAIDHWSNQVLFKELSVIYRAFALGTDYSLAELRIQYRHYAFWQRSVLKDTVLEKKLSYWKRQLGDGDLVLQLPTDYPRPAMRSLRGERITMVLPMKLVNELRDLGRKGSATLFMTLLAAFKLLLHRLTGQDDIAVGAPIAGRDRLETEGLIGLFLNTLVLRTDLSGNPTFLELLARVRDVTIGAYEHGDLPFEKLVEELKPRRDSGRTPLFQVLFNMYDLTEAELDLGALSVEALDVRETSSLYDLTLYMRKHGDATHLTLSYSTDLFGRPSMTEFFGQYHYLLEQIAQAPEQPIAAYSLVTPEAAAFLPNPSETLNASPHPLVTTMFTRQAKQRPTGPAVSQGQRSWTYGELAERAQLLARVLVARRVEPGEVVGVHGPSCFGLVAAAIGTLLSGGVLLLIDPNLPVSRKQLMLREARAKTVICLGGEKLNHQWLLGNDVGDILCVDSVTGLASELLTESHLETVSLPSISPDDAAYIFFTSGTTGIPKGVLGSHKGLSHFIDWQQKTFAVGPQDRVAQLSGLSFDVVLRDLFLPLCSGSILCLPEADDAPGSEQTLEWLERQHITLLHTVPTLAQHWLTHGMSGTTLSDLRVVFFAGEPLTDTLVQRWREAFPSCAELVNLYGPTETTLAKCFYRIPSRIRTGIQAVGRPLPETQALILRGKKQLCGVNELGEIVLRTPFRTLGYINGRDEQQQRFVRNPFTDDEADLLYFTGDTGRYSANGLIEILTRLDDQVKIRGVRVEPGEVAAMLSRHPGVASCFVAVKRDVQHGMQLIAYVVAKDRTEATVRKLMTYLAGELPGAMIPAAMVFINHLPLTANGKVDRAALSTLSPSKLDLDESHVAPRTPMEEKIAEIWAEVLRLDKVGIDDNFFELGGHSLMATQVVSRLRTFFNYDIALRTLFEAPTVEGLAAMIIRQQASQVSEAEMDRLLDDVDAMSSEDAEQSYKD